MDEVTKVLGDIIDEAIKNLSVKELSREEAEHKRVDAYLNNIFPTILKQNLRSENYKIFELTRDRGFAEKLASKLMKTGLFSDIEVISYGTESIFGGDSYMLQLYIYGINSKMGKPPSNPEIAP